VISTLYVRRTDDDPEARLLFKRFQDEGFNKLTDLKIERVFRLEGIEMEDAIHLETLLCNPSTETLQSSSTLDKSLGPIIEVGYQRAVTDPELPSIIRGAKSLNVPCLDWVRISHRYQFLGITEKIAHQIAERYLFNPQVQRMISSDESWDTLKPQGETGPVEYIDLVGLTVEKLHTLSENRRLFLNVDQMQALQQISDRIQRPLTDAEVEMFAQTWSDHCFHTTWKSLGLLQALWNTTMDIHHPLVLSVFEDNAGAMTFYDGWALTIKGETHNSPSAVSPYGGIMTKHGGVIRDTLGCGQGAWPIGGSTVMGLGDPRMHWKDVPKGALHPKTILVESIRGTADYTNPMGIPMMFPIYRFHAGYTGKCFALGHSIGIIPSHRAKKGRPKPGDLAILIGGLTGRDGLHGATVSSSSMTSKTAVVDAAHVQIGQPIEERKFMEAIPVLRDNDCLHAITDLGAAGLSSAAGEMGSETGVWINLACVHLKTRGMHPWEIWISESQERMLLCVPVGKYQKALDILEAYEVPAAVIGTFTDTKKCQVVFDEASGCSAFSLPKLPDLSGQMVVDLQFNELRKNCPLPSIALKKPFSKTDSFSSPLLKTEEDVRSAVKAVIGHLNCCDQSSAGFQFDKTVQGMIVTGPYGGIDGRMPNDVWISSPIRGKSFGAVAAVGFNPFYGDVDPAGMARLMMIEPISKLVAAGVNPEEIVLCDNFYTPRVNAEMASVLTDMVTSCCEMSRQLGAPFISGKDSSSGTFIGEDGKRLDIPPTLSVLALGRMKNVGKRIPKEFQQSGTHLLAAGPLTANLDGSIYWDTLGHRGLKLSVPTADELQSFWNRFIPLRDEGVIHSASAVAQGGLIQRIFEMALGSGFGCDLQLSELSEALNISQPELGLFAEMIGALFMEVSEENVAYVVEKLHAVILGKTIAAPKIIIRTESRTINFSMHSLISVWEKPFQEVAK
jgi:phosphoribosylformylglycinamidine synthase II